MHIHCHTVYIPSFLGREKVNERRERVGGGGWEGGLDKRMPKGGGGGGGEGGKAFRAFILAKHWALWWC